MKIGLWLLLAAAQVAGFVAPRVVRAQVVINEICPSPNRDWNQDGVVSSRDDEWVELFNFTDAVVPLEGYRLADADTTWRMGFTGSIQPHARVIVYGSDALAWEKATKHSATGLSLNNAGDTVRLWKFTGSDSVQVDFYKYSSAEGATDRTVGRFPDGTPTWKIFDALNPIPQGGNPPGTGCAPSPSSANGCPTAVASATWGQIRHWYLDENDGGPKPGGKRGGRGK